MDNSDPLFVELTTLHDKIRAEAWTLFNPYRREYLDLLHEVNGLLDEYIERMRIPHPLYQLPTGKSVEVGDEVE